MYWLVFLFGLASLTHGVYACTAFQIRSGDGAQIYCRSMEYGFDLQSNLLISPQGTEYTGTAPDGKPGIKWKNKYGFVGLNQNVSPALVSDGMNEKGLVVGVLYLPGFAEYQKPDSQKADQTLGAWELAAFLLGNCAGVDEVKSILDSVIVAQQPLPGTSFSFPLHYYIGDSKGDVVILEYVKGQKQLHNDPIGVLTNAPPFEWHILNLSNYVNLSPINVPDLEIKGDKIPLIGQGSGLLGIPGDYTPPSRFVRAALFSQWATPPQSALDTVRLGFHILNTFDIFHGIIREKEKPNAQLLSQAAKLAGQGADKPIETNEFTQWTVVHDRTNLKTYARSYASLQIQMVDLKKVDFKQPGLREVKLNRDFAVEDNTDQAKPLKKTP